VTGQIGVFCAGRCFPRSAGGCQDSDAFYQSPLYTAEAVVGADGKATAGPVTGGLTLRYQSREEAGGCGGPGNNPEQLSAVGCAVSFQPTLLAIARPAHDGQ
jgi:organic hydroperoxide reductase OsmC/OhrA